MKLPAPSCRSEGGYYQLTEMPEEFAGALGDGVSHRLMTERKPGRRCERSKLLWRPYRRERRLSIPCRCMCCMPETACEARQKMFVFDHTTGEAPFAHGVWQADLLPRFFKMRLDCGDAPGLPTLGLTRGVVFFLAPQNRDDGRALLAILARTPATQDLGNAPMPTTVN